MSDDPETARQIAELAKDTRPLLVLDVDDVVLEFIRPFIGFLGSQGLELGLKTFRLHGNIVELASNQPVSDDAVSALIDTFFDVQADWQTVAEGAAEAIAGLACDAEVVLLTAMPHRFHRQRRSFLDSLGIPYPLVTTESAKGPALIRLRGETARPIAFVDDMPHNLKSARASLPDVHLFHLMAMPSLRALLPPFADDIMTVDSWAEAGPRIAAALGTTIRR
jgi:hypothetical protein